jgi:branched-chain amino acid transport system ATP-binding protein
MSMQALSGRWGRRDSPSIHKRGRRSVDIALEGVSVFYGSVLAIDKCDLAVPAGDSVAIVGPNGNGKSSLVKAIAGLVNASGVVRVNGQQLRGSSRWVTAARAGISLVPERRGLFPAMTVKDNVLLGVYTHTRVLSRHHGQAVIDEVVALFPELGNKMHRIAGTLSGGEQQMVAIGRGLASQPGALILDEPSLGLSEFAVSRVYDALGDLAGGGRTLIVVEENPANALRLCRRVVSVERGIVREESAPQPADRLLLATDCAAGTDTLYEGGDR